MRPVIQSHWTSPNFGSRNNHAPWILLMHYTGMQSAEEALDRLCSPASNVSAHYVINEQGDIFSLVHERECAWHAGVSFWRGFTNINPVSIGIEIVNPGHEWGYRPFPQMQMEAVAALSLDIINRHKIAPSNVIGHSDVAPARKQDPGELFNWQWLAAQGIGLWPSLDETVHAASSPLTKPLALHDTGDEVATMQTNLARYGYQIPVNGTFDTDTQHVVVAFKRHFCPREVSGVWDLECETLLNSLLQKILV